MNETAPAPAGQFAVPPAGKIDFDTPPPPNASVQTLVPPVSDTPPSSVASQPLSSTDLSPAAAGADGAEAKVLSLVSDLEDIVVNAKSHISALVEDFETALAHGHKEIAAITNELKNGGIVSRLGTLELAVASQAAPAISHIAHDGLDLLHTWFNGIKEHYERAVAGVAKDKVDAAKAAEEAAAAKA